MYLPELNRIEGDQTIVVVQGGGRDEQIMRAYHTPRFLQARPQSGMSSRHHTIEVNDLNLAESRLHKYRAVVTPTARRSALNAVKQLRDCNGRDEERFVRVNRKESLQVELLPLGGDQN